MIKVSDWDRANAFYRDVVGAELIEIARGRFAYRLGRTQLNVHGPGSTAQPLPRQPVSEGNSDICLVWDGPIDAAVEHLRAHGVEPIEGPVPRQGAGGEGTSVYFNDPDGSLLEFISYEPG